LYLLRIYSFFRPTCDRLKRYRERVARNSADPPPNSIKSRLRPWPYSIALARSTSAVVIDLSTLAAGTNVFDRAARRHPPTSSEGCCVRRRREAVEGTLAREASAFALKRLHLLPHRRRSSSSKCKQPRRTASRFSSRSMKNAASLAVNANVTLIFRDRPDYPRHRVFERVFRLFTRAQDRMRNANHLALNRKENRRLRESTSATPGRINSGRNAALR